jgi:hypothetical protein
MLILLVLISYSYAATLTVDNRTPSAGQYSTIQAAHDAAVSGDDIYVYPSPNTYDGITVTKQVHIYGSGWGYNYAFDGICITKAGNVIFGSGSEGASISGMELSQCSIGAYGVNVSHCLVTAGMIIQANSVTIKENRVLWIEVNSGSLIEISKNYIYGVRIGWNANCSISIASGCSVNVFQNIISSPDHGIFLYQGSSTAYIVGNTINCPGHTIISYGPIPIGANNIIATSTYGLDATYWLNNIVCEDLSLFFVDAANGDYHLAPGSPAIGAGENGIDCGAYGGSSPFNDKLNTPELPTVIQLLTPTTIVPGSEPMPITIKARTNE